MSATKHAVVIIGGGVSGLYTALRLVQAGVTDIKLYEGRPFLGGRVRTTRDAEGSPKFNDFAWRIGAGNTRMLALAKELNIDLREQYTPPAGAPHDGHAKPAIEGRAPLSVFAQHTLEGTAGADQADRESGYAGRTAQITFPGESHAATNHVVINGMDEYVSAIAALLPDGVVNTGHRCTDVRRTATGYAIDISCNGEASTIETEKVVLAAPPVSLRQFSVAKSGLNPVLFAVHQRRLGHVYAQCTPGPNVPDTSDGEKRIYRSVPDSILQQIISGDYGNSIFQAGYACDRFERVWRELQFQGPDVMRAEVIKQLDRLADTVLPELKGVFIEEVMLRIGFVHRWQIEAHVSGKTKEELSHQAVYPNSANLPNLFIVGEAFSAHQGWTEGALQTAEHCVKILLAGDEGDDALASAVSSHSQPMALDTEGKTQMLYNGLVIDVSQFASRHPGGAGPIKGFSGKDATEIFENLHGGWPAPLATLFGLQAGVVRK